MKRFFMLILSVLMLSFNTVFAQENKVTGVVISEEDGLPIVGASVLVKGSTIGTITDIDGNFSILNLPSGAKKIVVSYIGMKSQEVKILSNLKIILKPDNQVLEEVMVVAYGTAKKASFTGSAEVIKADKLKERPLANVTKALDGLVAGVQTTSGSGQPGKGASVVIRGFGSINSSQNPLYVVDGVPYDGNISAINPNDIENMTVLKDASSGALYGARGANGVIMITTKKGKSGKININFKANWGVSSRAFPRYETMDEAGYLETVYQSYLNELIYDEGIDRNAAKLKALNNIASGSKAILGVDEQYNPFNYPIAQLIDPTTGKIRKDAKLKYSEDWMDEATRDNPLRQEYVASLRGGSDKTKYAFSLGYLNEKGLLKTTNFNRYSGRMSIDSQVLKWLKTGLSANFSRNESNSAAGGSASTSNVWYSAQLMGPIFPVYTRNLDGTAAKGEKTFDYGKNRPGGATPNFNTIATLYDDKYFSESDNLSSRMNVEVGNFDNTILDGLKLTVNYAFDLINSRGMTYYNPFFGNASATGGRITRNSSRTFSYTFNQLLSYNKSFGKHNIDVLVGHEGYKYQSRNLSGERTGFPAGGLYELGAAATLSNATSYNNVEVVESVLSRFNYNYADRYYLSLSYREDDSSRFYKENRRGRFWSLGGNWRISEESFIKDNCSWINNLSLKASYGLQGNNTTNSLYPWQGFLSLSYSNASMNGATMASLENKSLTWEKNGNLNVGIEAKIFNRYNVSAEWYYRNTTDMLLSYPMPTSTGFDGYDRNIGSMRNVGLDLSFRAQILRDTPLKWSATLLASTLSNKVTSLATDAPIINGIRIIKEGETLNSFYTANSAGVDERNGDQLYWAWKEDENGVRSRYKTNNKSLADRNREIQGSRIPDIYGSIQNNFSYKGFDLSALCTYSLGGLIYDSVYHTLLYGEYEGQTRSKDLVNAWREPGQITNIPRIQFNKSNAVTDADLIDASYFSLKNITLGYSLSSSLTKRIGVEALRFTLTGDNLFMLTHLRGMNPQYNFSGGTNFSYVPTRTISLGVDVKF